MRNKNVLITGTTGAIGKATIKLLNDLGYNIFGQYNTNDIEAEKLVKQYDKLKMYKADFLKISDIEYLVDNVIRDCCKIDILINNASSIYGAVDFLNINENDFDDTMNINFKAHFFITQKIIKNMIENNVKGKIINVSSISAKYGGGNTTIHYGCAKAALECLTKGIAKQFAKNNILSNCVQLGFIESDFHKKIGRTNDEIKQRIQMIPLKKAGKPEDATNMIEFLCSEKSDFITGQIFTVSGGD